MSKGNIFVQQLNQIIKIKSTLTDEEKLEKISALVSEEVTMGAPPYWKRLEGKLKVCILLGIIIDLIPDFEYHRQFVDGSNVALEFTGHLEGNSKFPVQGIDLITLDDSGRIVKLDVMIRPFRTLAELKLRVRERIT